MYTTDILLSSIEAVKKFVTLANQYDFAINLKTDKYTIDAKSIMGVFSLDLSKPVTVQMESPQADRFMQEIAEFQLQKA
ncbi:HPr family phosphocarrier protein [Clostridium minihomine]|uniref:HPr family phosphocarrier protein n=1 Tax=Clostridium minihomine TaxID=2045012 RepID=UPI000C76425E|nr:HPr family phosphocarrier protein [Clostridium minihomine]